MRSGFYSLRPALPVGSPIRRRGVNQYAENLFFGDCQFGVFSRAMISRMRAF